MPCSGLCTLPSPWDSIFSLKKGIFCAVSACGHCRKGRRHPGNPSQCCWDGQGQHRGISRAWRDRLCKEERESLPWCENSGFAVLILPKSCLIIRGICTNISRFCLSLLESVFSAVNQSLANLQKLSTSAGFFPPPLSAGNAAQVTNVL